MGKREKLVLVGNGMAGVNVIEHVLKLSGNRYEIVIFGSEPHPNYNRILLSSVLAGDAKMDDIVINDFNWYKDNGIQLHTNETVVSIDTENKLVRTANHLAQPYDSLIIATGSLPFMLPLPGADKEGVIAFRDMKDCEAMIESAKKYRKAAVIGGGLLGLEAARGLLNLNMEVDVIHLQDFLMERQLDETAARMLQKELKRQGMNFLLKKSTAQILGKERVTGLQFTDGTSIKTDLVVMAVGIRPNVLMAKNSGIEVNRGIVVNDFMQTSSPHIYAVGECAEHRGIVYGLVAPLWEQGAVLAKHLCGIQTEPYQGSVVSAKLKVSGVDVFSAGEFIDSDDTSAIRIHDEWSGVYKKVLLRGKKVVGGVLFGDASDSSKLLQWIRSGTEMTDQLHGTLIGKGDPDQDAAAVQSMPDEELICGCNGVSKGAIVKAIKDNELTSVEQIKDCTNASRSCGGCRPMVEQLLKLTLGDKFDPNAAPREAICRCTALSHSEVVAEIRDKGLTHVREAMNVLGWSNPEGCPKCRPALNYYIGMVHPVFSSDERDSRLVNERMHANIQNDGTYSVVPRMYGGVTSPAELRKIADVAEKFKVRMVKVTGGQRIDLLGVEKKDLPAIWEELGMPSGFAYGKAIRTVKTCVGTEFCRYGVGDAIQMGIEMEKKFERLNTPHKVKMAVSGCPRNCAESLIKDLGVVAVENGWEIYVGGNGGIKLRSAELLCKVKTEQEVIEIAGAYLQYYRETGNYWERTSGWVERIGLTAIRKAVVDDLEERAALNERIELALAQLQDPWKEIAENPEVRQTLFEDMVPFGTK